MNLKKILSISSALFFVVNKIYGNDNSNLESLEEDGGEIIENLIFKRKNINKATREDFLILNAFSKKQIDDFFEHKKICGEIISKYELQTINSFSKKDIEIILKYFEVEELDEPVDAKKIFSKEKNHSLRLIYQGKHHPIDEEKINHEVMLKGKFQLTNNLEFGFGTKKRMEDEFFLDVKMQAYLFSIYRGYFLYKSKKFFKNIITGSFNVGAGQGLLLNSGFSCGIGSDAVKIMRVNNNGLVPYSSFGESKFFGAGINLGNKNYDFIIFGSSVLLDHIVKENDDGDNVIFSKPNRSAKNIVFENIFNRNTQQQNSFGCIGKFITDRGDGELGISNLLTFYEIPHFPKDCEEGYIFSGDKIWAQTIFSRWTFNNISLFGEGGYSKNFSEDDKTYQEKSIQLAGLAGILASLHKKFDIASALRWYAPGFVSFFGNPLKSQSDTRNEFGYYLGLEFKPKYFFVMQFFFDISNPLLALEEKKFKTLQFGNSVTYFPNRNLKSMLKYSFKNKRYEFNFLEKNSFSHRIKNQTQYTFSKTFSSKLELHLNKRKEKNKNFWSYAVLKDFTYKKFKIKLTTRLGWVSSENIKNAIRSYEPSLFGGEYGFKTYNFSGILFCEKISLKVNNFLKLEGKYSLQMPLEKKEGESDKKIINKHIIALQIAAL